MISNIAITGAVGEKFDKIYRYIDVDRPVPANRKYVIDKIPTCHWSKTHNCTFQKLPVGACVSLTGRLEMDEKHGLVVIVQQFLILSRNDKMKLVEGDPKENA